MWIAQTAKDKALWSFDAEIFISESKLQSIEGLPISISVMKDAILFWQSKSTNNHFITETSQNSDQKRNLHIEDWRQILGTPVTE